jgi:membrane protein YqaA with SNARE-associated domain
MLEGIIYDLGYIGIFLISFLASSIFPLSSEPFVALMVYLDYNILLILVFATIGNFLGSLSNYYFGLLGDKFFLSKYIKEDNKYRLKAEKIFNRFASWALFFSWIPIVGDLFCVYAGTIKYNLKRFSVIVFLGKLIRFIIVLFVSNLLIK